jgi:hypothetical protein
MEKASKQRFIIFIPSTIRQYARLASKNRRVTLLKIDKTVVFGPRKEITPSLFFLIKKDSPSLPSPQHPSILGPFFSENPATWNSRVVYNFYRSERCPN